MSAGSDLKKLKAKCKEGETEAQHAKHADSLAAAYKAFAEQRDEDSNPAAEGETDMTADVVVTSVDPD